jgi:hypothetical protein
MPCVVDSALRKIRPDQLGFSSSRPPPVADEDVMAFSIVAFCHRTNRLRMPERELLLIERQADTDSDFSRG